MTKQEDLNSPREPLIAIGSLGGTIAMTTAQGAGTSIQPALAASDLTESVPGLDQLATISTRDICNVASSSLEVSNILEALRFAEESVDAGAAGVVLTQGTDTLEETAFLLDLLWGRAEPLVVTGAMRSSSQLGADGPTNIRDAVVTASSPHSRRMGVLAVMAGEVHLARTVTKAHSSAISAFVSPDGGPIGHVRESRLTITLRPAKRFSALPIPTDNRIAVPLVEMGFGDDGSVLEAVLSTNPRAVVIGASGAGHVPQQSLSACQRVIDSGCPLVFASRTGAGGTLLNTYGYAGGEEDLIRRGAIPAGTLTPRKARLLAYVLATAGFEIGEFRDQFAVRGQ